MSAVLEKARLQRVMQRLSIVQLFCAFIGVICFVAGNEMLWTRVQKSGLSLALQNGEALSQSSVLIPSAKDMCGTVSETGLKAFGPILFTQIVLTFSTLVLLVCIFMYWKARYEAGILDGKYIPRAFFKSSAFTKLLMDIVVCGFHCPPYIGGCLPRTLLLSAKYYSHYHYQMLSMTVLIFRWHLVLRFLRYNNLFTRDSSNTFTTMYNIHVSEFTQIKVFLDQHPVRFLTLMTFICIFLFAYLSMCFERAAGDGYHQQFFLGSRSGISSNVLVDGAYWANSYFTNIWFTWICVTTIGLGDWYPLTAGGRVIAVCANTVGTIIYALLINSVARALSPTRSEGQTIGILKFLADRKQVAPTAANLINFWWRSKKLYMKHHEHHVAKYMFYKRKWNIIQKDKQKYLLENANDVIIQISEVQGNVSEVLRILNEQRGLGRITSPGVMFKKESRARRLTIDNDTDAGSVLDGFNLGPSMGSPAARLKSRNIPDLLSSPSPPIRDGHRSTPRALWGQGGTSVTGAAGGGGAVSSELASLRDLMISEFAALRQLHGQGRPNVSVTYTPIANLKSAKDSPAKIILNSKPPRGDNTIYNGVTASLELGDPVASVEMSHLSAMRSVQLQRASSVVELISPDDTNIIDPATYSFTSAVHNPSASNIPSPAIVIVPEGF